MKKRTTSHTSPSRGPLLAFAWIATLALLAWAVTPGGAFTPATSWRRDTFAVRMSDGSIRWVAAPEGGYARPDSSGAHDASASFRPVEVDPELAATRSASAVDRSGDYVDLGR